MTRPGTFSKRSPNRRAAVEDRRRPHGAASTTGAGAALVIDGTAKVTARRIVEKTPAKHGAAHPETHQAPSDASPAQGFGRRRESFFDDKNGFGRASRGRVTLLSKRHLTDGDRSPDLLRQSLDLSQHRRFFSGAGSLDAEAPLPPIERGLGRRARNAAFVTAGFLVGVLSIPVFLLSVPNVPVAAPYRVATQTPDLPTTDGFSLDGVEASLVAHGTGTILTVEGTIRNTADAAGLVPSLRIAMRDTDGILSERPLRVGVDRLAAGRTVRFVSRLAVASDAAGEVSIGFLPAPKSRVAVR